jgi:hypothetical protein
LPGLAWVVYEDADKVQIWVLDQVTQRTSADVSGGPLDHS